MDGPADFGPLLTKIVGFDCDCCTGRGGGPAVGRAGEELDSRGDAGDFGCAAADDTGGRIIGSLDERESRGEEGGFRGLVTPENRLRTGFLSGEAALIPGFVGCNEADCRRPTVGADAVDDGIEV